MAGVVMAAVEDRVGREMRVDLESFVCRLTAPLPATFTATPDPTGRTGQAVRFVLASEPGPQGNTVRLGEVTTVVRIYGSHVRARKALDAGRAVGRDDVEVADGQVDGAPLRRLPTTADVTGSRTFRPVAAGEAIVASALVGVPVVKAGDRVRAVARAAGIEVSMVAVAEQSGMPDQVIRVVNPDSRRAVRARVVSAGEVEVVSGR